MSHPAASMRSPTRPAIVTPTGSTPPSIDALSRAQCRGRLPRGRRHARVRPTRTRPLRRRARPGAVEVAWRLAAESADGRIASLPGAPGLAWTGFRYRLDDTRVACVLVARAGLDDLAVARLEAVTLDLVRAALVRDQADSDGAARPAARHRSSCRRIARPRYRPVVDRRRRHDAARRRQRRHAPVDRERDVLRVVALSNFPPEMMGFELQFGEGVSSQRDPRPPDDRGRRLRRPTSTRQGARRVRLRGRPLRAAAHPWRRDRRDQRPCPGRPAQLSTGRRRPPRGVRRACGHRHRPRAPVRKRGQPRAGPGRDQSRDHPLAPGPAASRRAGPPRRRPAGDRDGAGRASWPPRRHPGPPPSAHCRRSPGRWRRVAPARRGPRSGRPRRAGPEAFSIAVRVGNDVVGHLLLSSDEDLGPIDRHWSTSPQRASRSSSQRSARPPRSRSGCAVKPRPSC